MKASGTRAASNQAAVFLSFAATLALGLALIVLLGRALPPAAFGFFALVLTIFAFARDAIDLGSSSVAAREMRRAPEGERRLMEGLYQARRLMAAALAAGVLVLALAHADPTRRLALLAVAATVAVFGPTAYHALFHVRQAFGVPSAIGAAGQMLLLAACAAALALGADGPEVAGLVVLRELAVVVAIALAGRRLAGYPVRPRAHWEALRPFYAAAGIAALAALTRHVQPPADVLMVRALVGEDALGGWAAAARLFAPAFALPWIVAQPLVPVLSDPGGRQAHGRLLGSALALALALGALAGAGAWALAPDLVALVYGGRYLEGPLSAVETMRTLAFALAPVSVTAVAVAGLLAARRERLVLAVAVLALAARLAGNAALIPAWGFVAAAWTTAAAEWAVAVALCLALTGVSAPAAATRSVVRALVPAAALAASLSLVDAAPAWRVAAGIALGALALGAIFATAPGRDYARALREIGR